MLKGNIEVTHPDIWETMGNLQVGYNLSLGEIRLETKAVERILTHPDYLDLLQLKQETYATSSRDPAFRDAVGQIISLEAKILDDTGTQSHQEQIAAGAMRRARERL